MALSFPVLAQQIYAFVAPGLYKKERRAFLPFLIASPVLFAIGAALVYYMILPFVLWFALQPADRRRADLGAADVDGLRLFRPGDDAAAGLRPVLPAAGDPDPAGHGRHRQLQDADGRLALCRGGVVVVAAIITPPDPISQILLSLPIFGLYFVSIGCVWLIELRPQEGRRSADRRRTAWGVGALANAL